MASWGSWFSMVLKTIRLDDFTLAEFKAISPVFEEDIYEAIGMKHCVEKRVTMGAPGEEAMRQEIAQSEALL